MAPKRKEPTGDQGLAAPVNPDEDTDARRVRPKGVSPAEIIERLEKSFKWLCDADKDRTVAYETYLERIGDFLDTAEVARREHPDAFDEQACQVLRACKAMCAMHERYNDWCYGLTKWSTHAPVKMTAEKRLVPYNRMLPLPDTEEGRRPSTYTSMVPRPDELTYPPFVRITPNRDRRYWAAYFTQPQGIYLQRYFTEFYSHARLWWALQPTQSMNWTKIPAFVNPRNPEGINYAELENMAYEDYIKRDLEELAVRPASNKTAQAAEFEDFAVQRGWRRAALQRVLFHLSGRENSEVNSPWRRVIHPKPVEKPKINHIKPLTLPRIYDAGVTRNNDRCAKAEPSPWIYWYNQWLQQIKYLSGWSRSDYNRRHWEDFKQVALPMNYLGPFLVSDRCVYDDRWLKMGRYLVALQKNLEKMSVTRRRWLIERVVEDIKQGESGGSVPDDVMGRDRVDIVEGTADQFVLVDETDVAWLKFLCDPSATRGLVGLSHGKPEDTLTILLDHRIQLLINDPLHNPFWVKDSRVEKEDQSSWRAEQIALEDLVPMLNLGGRDFFEVDWSNGTKTEVQRAARLNKNLKGVEPPNTLYQFSLKEAVKHCTKLAKMGRIEYKRPVDPKDIKEMWWSGTGNLYYYPDENWETAGGYVCPTPPGISPWTHDELNESIDQETNPARYPEERIRWRHRTKAALDTYNEGLCNIYATEMSRRQRNTVRPVTQHSLEAYRGGFLEEFSWKEGPDFSELTPQAQRDMPGWQDLVDYRTVIQKDIGYSWRTINFLRILAFRMGRTIRHCMDLAAHATKESALTREHLYSALEEWKRGTEGMHLGSRGGMNGVQCIPFRASRPNAILEQIDKSHVLLQSENMVEVFRVIRHGIIEDMVQSRTMLYPGRSRRYTDKKRKTTFQCYERENIWSWASEPIRKRHAAYRRKLYFDMRRWPLNRQREDTRRRITKREDEDPSIQPVSAFYKYDLRVGPALLTPKHSDLISNAIRSLGDPDKERVVRELLTRLGQQLTDMVGKTNDYDKNWQIQIVPPQNKAVVAEAETTTATTTTTTTTKPKLKPRSDFIPGRARFVMGDSLRQQMKLSHDIERILEPRPGFQITEALSHLFKSAPERVKLLPDIDENRAPQSNSLKRKIPSSFVTTADIPSKLQALADKGTGRPVSPPRRPVTRRVPQVPPQVRETRSSATREPITTRSPPNPPPTRTAPTTTTQAAPTTLPTPATSRDIFSSSDTQTAPEPSPPRPNVGRPNVAVPGRTSIFSTIDNQPSIFSTANTQLSTNAISNNQSGISGRPTPLVDVEPDTETAPKPPPPRPDVGRPKVGRPPNVAVPAPSTGAADVQLVENSDGSRNVTITPNVATGLHLGNRSQSVSTVPPTYVNVGGLMTPVTANMSPPREVQSKPDAQQRRNSVHQWEQRRNSVQQQPTPGPEMAEIPRPPILPPIPYQLVSPVEEARIDPETRPVIERPTRVTRPPVISRPEPDNRPLTIERQDQLQRKENERYLAELEREATYSELEVQYRAAFPRGFRVVPTSGQDWECGLYAMVESVRAQHGGALGGEVPTMRELRLLVRKPDDPAVRDLVRELGIDNTNNLSVDQMAAVLHAWGRRRGRHLRLAIYRGAEAAQSRRGRGGAELMNTAVPDPPPGAEVLTVWVHSNASAESTARSRQRDYRGGRLLTIAEARRQEPAANHFSGMEPRR